MIKKIIIASLLVFVAAQPAAALNTEELLSLVAMPLAVAAVAELADVPTRDLVSVVSALNQAAVPPAQFIEVVRFVPVALVDTTTEPRFVTFVTTQVDQGLRGDALAFALADRLRVHGVQEINVVDPPTLVVVEEQRFVPPVVITRIQPADSVLALIAMPLAVAAVAELTDIPTQDLITLVTTLNQANVPPAQFIEVVRYVPVVLVDQTAVPQFTNFVATQATQGVTGIALASAIADRLRIFGVREINVIAPPVVVERELIPAVVVTRVAQLRQHPHGGPPGQLKKAAGVQTGAEIVHGTKPGREVRPMPATRVVPPPAAEKRGGMDRPHPGKGGPGRGGPPPGQEKGKPGKGKGKGKDR